MEPRHVRAALLIAVSLAACVLAAGCSSVDVLNALVPRDTYVATTSLRYGARPREALDVYVPSPGVNGAPVVVFFYGGSWAHGERADYRFVGEALASRGFVAIVPDYRLYPDVSYPDFLRDSAAAVAWARREARRFGGDPKRLFVMGHSAGGYNAAMLALDPRWLRAEGLSPADLNGWIGLAGPYDFLPSDLPGVQRVFHHPAYPAGAQPIDHVTSDSPPAFIGAARSDDVVSPTRSSQQMVQRLEAAGVPVTAVFYPRINHYLLAGALARPLRFIAPVLDDVAAFINGGAPGAMADAGR